MGSAGTDLTTTEGPAGASPERDAEAAIEGNRRLFVAFAVIGVIVLVAGLVVGTRSRGATSDWAGTVLPAAQEKPDLVLTDTSGRPYDLRAETKGVMTLLMFGYTNCPDYCPISLSTLSTAMDDLDLTKGQGLRMVFVTVDPQRDTPEVLRSYLDRFNVDFVGLTGTPEQIAAAQAAAGVPPAKDDPATADGAYTVGHATQMIAYQPDGTARIVYPFGTRRTDWNRDLPRLLAGEQPS